MINKIHLLGRVGSDPETRIINEETQVSKFTFATDDGWGEKKTTDWHSVVVWNKLSKVIESYVKKGSLLYLEGRVKYRSWDDADGNKKYKTEIVAEVIKLLDKKDEED